MSFEARLFEPMGQEAVPDVIGMYALQVASNVQKSGDILQMIANESGIPLLGSDLFMQHRRRIFDMAAKNANQPTPDVYQTMSRHRNDFFMDLIEKHGYSNKTTLGIGDSLGVAAIQGMQLYSNRHIPVFDGLLLRDGWNLRISNKAFNIAHFALYTLADRLQQGSYSPAVAGLKSFGYREMPLIEPDETHDLVKVWNVADMMRAPLNRRVALELATNDRFAMNVVLFDHGASGNNRKQRAFVDDLYQARGDNNPASFKAEVVAGWHSDLLNPWRAADDIKQTLDQIAA